MAFSGGRWSMCLLALALFALPAVPHGFLFAGGRPQVSAGRLGVRRPMVLDGLAKLVQDKSAAVAADMTRENEELLEGYKATVQSINGLEKDLEALTDGQLRGKTKEFKERLASGEALDAVLPEAFAVVRETAWRILGLRHYDVQLMAGLTLHDGRLAEMATGEGKTLAATLPVYLNALAGEGVVVVTANDYLARRDAETVGQVYRFLGLSVGLIQPSSTTEERREAYEEDITFATHSELGFDYLRDHLAYAPDQVVLQRLPQFCLVDEADSILIDEARTPLIISKQTEAPQDKYAIAAKIAGLLKVDKHFTADLKGQSITITDEGFKVTEEMLGKSLFDSADPWAPFVMNAVKARALFQKDQQYIIQSGEDGKEEVAIVDTFSGRVMDGRRWSDGLQQAIEAKEEIPVSTESQVTATVTYQSLFRLFPRLAGMSGTAMSDAKELSTVYGLPVTPIPTALPVARRDYPDVIYRSEGAKLKAVVAEVERQYETGRPVLIGTTSVAASEELCAKLRETLDNPDCVMVLNALPEVATKEGEVVSQAGRIGKVTVATNMAGRGTDILLGGNPAMMAKLRVRDSLLGVVDDSDKGKVEPLGQDFYPCELSEEAQSSLDAAVNMVAEEGTWSLLELEEILSIAAEKAPVKDETVLALRAALAATKEDFSESLVTEKEEVRKLGGLYVVGTERHESSRIDRQLRGRAGRQGDPGGSRFFLSLEDPVLRNFGADRVRGLMDTFRLGDDIPLEAKSVAEAIDSVQKKVENYFAEIREQVFTFDEVLATQRESLYTQRQATLLAPGDQMEESFRTACMETLDEILPNYLPLADSEDTAPEERAEALVTKLVQFFPGLEPVEGSTLVNQSPDEVAAWAKGAMTKAVETKKSSLESVREGQFWRSAQYLLLLQLDNGWASHLRSMNYLKESVVLRKYQGKDVLQEYVIEGAKLYDSFRAAARRNAVYSLMVYDPTPKTEGR